MLDWLNKRVLRADGDELLLRIWPQGLTAEGGLAARCAITWTTQCNPWRRHHQPSRGERCVGVYSRTLGERTWPLQEECSLPVFNLCLHCILSPNMVIRRLSQLFLVGSIVTRVSTWPIGLRNIISLNWHAQFIIDSYYLPYSL